MFNYLIISNKRSSNHFILQFIDIYLFQSNKRSFTKAIYFTICLFLRTNFSIPFNMSHLLFVLLSQQLVICLGLYV